MLVYPDQKFGLEKKKKMFWLLLEAIVHETRLDILWTGAPSTAEAFTTTDIIRETVKLNWQLQSCECCSLDTQHRLFYFALPSF